MLLGRAGAFALFCFQSSIAQQIVQLAALNQNQNNRIQLLIFYSMEAASLNRSKIGAESRKHRNGGCADSLPHCQAHADEIFGKDNGDSYFTEFAGDIR